MFLRIFIYATLLNVSLNFLITQNYNVVVWHKIVYLNFVFCSFPYHIKSDYIFRINVFMRV